MSINLRCPISSLGIGCWSAQFANALARHCDLRLDTSMQFDPIGFEDFQGLRPCLKQLASKPLDIDAPTISLGQAYPVYIANYGHPRIIYPIWETTQLYPHEKELIQRADYVWAPSNWAKRILEDNGITGRISVVPLGVDTEFYCPQGRGQSYLASELATLRTEGYKIFFSGGKFEKRKGHHLILDTLSKFFTDQKICLLAHWDNPFIQQFDRFLGKLLMDHGCCEVKLLDETRHYSMDNIRIFPIPRVNSFKTVRSLYAEADFGLFPAFAEGWNLPLIEMMSMEKPCIATNYSAHTDFIDRHSPLTIQQSEGQMVPANDGVWFHGDRGDWFEPTSWSFKEKIELALNMNETEIASLGILSRDSVREFTWDNAAAKAMELLEIGA